MLKFLRYLFRRETTTVSNNRIHRSGRHGINVAGQVNVRIEGNTVTDAVGDAIHAPAAVDIQHFMHQLGLRDTVDPRQLALLLQHLQTIGPSERQPALEQSGFLEKFGAAIIDVSTFVANVVTIVGEDSAYAFIKEVLSP